MGGQGVSAFGDAVTFTALPLLVVLLTGSGVAMGVVGTLSTIPDLVFGLVAGALADRWDRRRMMLYSDIGRAVLTAMIPISYLLGIDTMGVILLVTLPINALRVLFMAGFTAAVPALVGRDQISRASGVVEAVSSLSFIVGPSIAGVLVNIVGAAPTLAIDAVSFLFSAGALWFIRRPMKAQRDPLAAPQHIVADIAEGLRFIVGERTLRTAIGFWGLVSVVGAPVVPAVIFYLVKDLHQPEAVVGLVLSGYGVGYLAGALLAGRFAKGRLGLIMLYSNAAQGLALLLFAVGGTSLIEFAAAAAAGFFGALVLIPYVTLRASIPPNELLGRVGSAARTLSFGLSPVGLLVGGVLLDAVGGEATMIVIGAVGILASAGFALAPAMRHAVAGTGRRP